MIPLVAAICGLGLIASLLNRPSSWLLGVAALSSLLIGLGLHFFIVGGLRVRVTNAGVAYKFIGRTHLLLFSQIERVEVIDYRPIRDFGGWGVRWVPGTVIYNVHGTRAVRIGRAGARDLVLGSQLPDALAAAIQNRLRAAVGVEDSLNR